MKKKTNRGKKQHMENMRYHREANQMARKVIQVGDGSSMMRLVDLHYAFEEGPSKIVEK